MTDLRLECRIPGEPQQQGSKSQGRHGQMYEANPRLERWRVAADVFLRQARGRHGIRGPIRDGVSVEAVFAYQRPKSHYRTGRFAHLLRDDAPVWKTSKPDTDHLQRALGDALTAAGILTDDALIVHWNASKAWADSPSVTVTIRKARP